MQACQGFPLPGGTIPSLTVFHFGTDSFDAEWVRFLLDDSTWVDCGHVGLDNGGAKSTECVPYKPS